MSVARDIIKKCGGGNFSAGVALVARWTGVHSSRVHRWTYSKSKGGTDGIIPSQHQQKILDRAREAGIDLTPADFFQVAA